MTVLTSTRGEAGLPRWFDAVFASLQRIRAGRIDIHLPDGRIFRADGPEPGPYGQVVVNNPGLPGRLLRDGDVAFGEAYMEGWWDSPDLQAVMDVMLLNVSEVARSFPGMGLVRAYEQARHWLRSNSKTQAKRNIAHHYDLGNDFYGRWLDPSMTYSSALFERDEDLPTAQTNKYAAMCDSIGVTPDSHVLEIGCGWGGFAEYAASARGAKITALTISRAQHDFAKERVFKAGLNERVEIQLKDYREERGSYDGVASIEMFEAVGEKYWPTFFNSLKDRMRPGGLAALQIITIDDGLFAHYRRSVDFIQKYIFPGGMLPSPAALNQQIARAGLDRVGSREFGLSYAETLRQWHQSFNAAWAEIETQGFDDRFRRMWNYYLTSCASSFEFRATDVTQVAIRKGA